MRRLSEKIKGESGPLARTVLSDQVKDIIVDAILNGELEAGERVVENTLARQLGVSQAPVRDAIRDLVMMGFLKSEPFKGATVRSFSPEELNEVYLVRASLESLASRLAAPRITDEDLHGLKKILDKMVAASKRQDVKTTTELNNEFHETIIKISGNKLLHQIWRSLMFGYWTIVTVRFSSFDLEYLARRHEEILDALSTRDPFKAMLAMQHHLEGLGSPVTESSNDNT